MQKKKNLDIIYNPGLVLNLIIVLNLLEVDISS